MLFSLFLSPSFPTYSILQFKGSFKISKFFFHQKLTFYQKTFDPPLVGISRVTRGAIIMRPSMAKGPKLGIWSYMYYGKLYKMTVKISPHSSLYLQQSPRYSVSEVGKRKIVFLIKIPLIV